jgi:hypothetical protein
MEKSRTDNPDLHGRRQALANADSKAGQCHSLQTLFVNDSGIEAFALKTDSTIVEKKKKQHSHTAKCSQMARRLNDLYERKMEGANHRAGETPGCTTGSR